MNPAQLNELSDAALRNYFHAIHATASHLSNMINDFPNEPSYVQLFINARTILAACIGVLRSRSNRRNPHPVLDAVDPFLDLPHGGMLFEHAGEGSGHGDSASDPLSHADPGSMMNPAEYLVSRPSNMLN